MKFYSQKNPNKLLKVHLEEVYHNASKDALYNEEIRIVSLMHDFGKYTSYFQEYLNTGNETVLGRHGFISAVAAAFVSFKTINNNNSALDIYSCVLHHHGNLRSISHNLPRRRNKISKLFDASLMLKIKNTQIRIEDMKNNLDTICSEYDEFGYGELIREFITDCDIKNILIQLKKTELVDEEDYMRHQYIYSRLVYADKISASNTTVPVEKYVSYDRLECERQKFVSEKNPLDEIRNDIFNTVQSSLESNYNSADIFSITAPTGTGKTFSGFFAALKLRELANMKGKIIYTLPFTSIINHNYKSLKQLFENCENEDDNEDSYILMHNLLGDIKYNGSGNSGKVQEIEKEDYWLMQEQLLFESWSCGITVTTFVHLMETLIGVRNKMLEKFHHLENSIIIIDEIQSVDIKYHKLIEYVLTLAVKKLNCKIIFMSATKHAIFKGALELLDRYEKYYRLFNRTKLLVDLKPVTCNKFVDRFISSYNEKKSYLIVCNTVKQAQKVYNVLAASKEVKNDMLFYLSTNIIPLHRENVINYVKDLLKEEERKPLLISTQVVEAGLELDFDEVYRDIAPFDSIIQCAGRCNRNNRKNQGNDNKNLACGSVHIINMISKSSSKSFASMVYRQKWLNLTIKLLDNREIIEEREYLKMINKYFELINQNTSDIEYDKYKKAINGLDFDNIGEFNIIKGNDGYTDVFINVDDEAEENFELFNRVMDIKNITARHDQLLIIKENILQYIISVPSKYRTRFESNPYMLFLPRKECCDDGEYSKTTGLNPIDDFDQFF